MRRRGPGGTGAVVLCALLATIWAAGWLAGCEGSAPKSSASARSPVAEARPVGGRESSVSTESSVILISLDGTRPADLREDTLPSLTALAANGARAVRLVPVSPSNTFPNHVSMVTGVAPDRHGIVNNVFVDPERGTFDKSGDPDWIEVEPIWSLLRRQGVESATYYWVGSEGPWHGQLGPREWRKFSSRTSERVKVAQILAWLDEPDPEKRPRLVTSWFHGADHAGHLNGPDSDEVRSALRKQDEAIAELIAGLEERGLFASTTLIFVSDHGMARPARRVDLGAALRKAGVEARVLGIGGFASVVLEHPERSAERAVEVARGLGLEAHRRESAPTAWRVANPRFGDVVVRAPIDVAIRGRGRRLEGFHGYDPLEPAMGGIFIAAGRGVAPGQALPELRAIDVAPTVLALLDTPVPDWMEGRPVAALVPQPGASARLPRGTQAAIEEGSR